MSTTQSLTQKSTRKSNLKQRKTDNTQFRFLQYLDYRTTGCWFWMGYKDKDGYGKFSYGLWPLRKTVRAHRAAWLLYRGIIPDRTLVLHTCDLPLCVNPNHLYLGNMADNVRDRLKRGRGAKGARNGMRLQPPKLNYQKANEILVLLKDSSLTQQQIANRFHVTQTMISAIKRGVAW